MSVTCLLSQLIVCGLAEVPAATGLPRLIWFSSGFVWSFANFLQRILWSRISHPSHALPKSDISQFTVTDIPVDILQIPVTDLCHRIQNLSQKSFADSFSTSLSPFLQTGFLAVHHASLRDPFSSNWSKYYITHLSSIEHFLKKYSCSRSVFLCKYCLVARKEIFSLMVMQKNSQSPYYSQPFPHVGSEANFQVYFLFTLLITLSASFYQ